MCILEVLTDRIKGAISFLRVLVDILHKPIALNNFSVSNLGRLNEKICNHDESRFVMFPSIKEKVQLKILFISAELDICAFFTETFEFFFLILCNHCIDDLSYTSTEKV